MGIHTGDSITVAPAMTLPDTVYQHMRDLAIRMMNGIGKFAGWLQRSVLRQSR